MATLVIGKNEGFNGEVPKLPADRLPAGYAARAVNCDYAHGELRSIGALGETHTVNENARPVRSVFTPDGVGFFVWNKPTKAYLWPTIDDMYKRVLINTEGDGLRVGLRTELTNLSAANSPVTTYRLGVLPPVVDGISTTWEGWDEFPDAMLRVYCVSYVGDTLTNKSELQSNELVKWQRYSVELSLELLQIYLSYSYMPFTGTVNVSATPYTGRSTVSGGFYYLFYRGMMIPATVVAGGTTWTYACAQGLVDVVINTYNDAGTAYVRSPAYGCVYRTTDVAVPGWTSGGRYDNTAVLWEGGLLVADGVVSMSHGASGEKNAPESPVAYSGSLRYFVNETARRFPGSVVVTSNTLTFELEVYSPSMSQVLWATKVSATGVQHGSTFTFTLNTGAVTGSSVVGEAVYTFVSRNVWGEDSTPTLPVTVAFHAGEAFNVVTHVEQYIETTLITPLGDTDVSAQLADSDIVILGGASAPVDATLVMWVKGSVLSEAVSITQVDTAGWVQIVRGRNGTQAQAFPIGARVLLSVNPVRAPVASISVYRAEGSTGQYFLIADIPVDDYGYCVWTDNGDAASATVLESTTWDLPPDNAENLTYVNNGFFCVSSGKELVFSEPYHPHAWPYRMLFPYDIVGVTAVSGGVLVTTTSQPWLVMGSTPLDMSQQQLEIEQQGWVGTAITRVEGAAVYASNDGLVSTYGGQPTLTDSQALFTRRDWESFLFWRRQFLRMDAHDGSIVCVVDPAYLDENNVEPPGGVFPASDEDAFLLRLDESAGSFSRLDFGEPVYGITTTDAVDKMFVGTATGVAEYGAGAPLEKNWLSKTYVYPKPVSFGAAIVECDGAVGFELLREGVPVFSRAMEGVTRFRLPAAPSSTKWAVRLTGTGTVRSVELGSSFAELQGV